MWCLFDGLFVMLYDLLLFGEVVFYLVLVGICWLCVVDGCML